MIELANIILPVGHKIFLLAVVFHVNFNHYTDHHQYDCKYNPCSLRFLGKAVGVVLDICFQSFSLYCFIPKSKTEQYLLLVNQQCDKMTFLRNGYYPQ